MFSDTQEIQLSELKIKAPRNQVGSNIPKFDFDDLLIEPAIISQITSRTEICPFYRTDRLPLIAAPMDTVIGEENYKLFIENGIDICLHRTITRKEEIKKWLSQSGKTETTFFSYSLDDFLLKLNSAYEFESLVLIDIANGHMKKLLDAIKEFKSKFPTNKIMVGNIANPETYRELSDAGADFIRTGIGNGGGCLTTQQTGIGFPMASLIRECYLIAQELRRPAKIVADGGFKEYSDIIKALALGADYVMIGSILNKALESAGPTYWKKIPIKNQWLLNFMYKNKFTLVKKFRGMSTKEVQKTFGNQVLKTSEGVIRFRKVEYRLDGWTKNFSDYLKSAMSYCNKRDLNKFIGQVNFNLITTNAYRRFNK